jgi:hypothetical protein
MGYHYIGGTERQQREGRRKLFRGIRREMLEIRARIGVLKIPAIAVAPLTRLQSLQSTLPEWRQYAASDCPDIKEFAERKLLECEAEIQIIERQIRGFNISDSDLEELKLALSHQQELAEHAHELMLDYSDSQLADPVTENIIRDLHPEVDAWVCDIIFGPGNYHHDI